MKQTPSLLLALAFALPFSAPAARAVEVDGLAARVGSESILKSEVAEELRRSGGDPSRFNEVRSEMIDRKLILKAAADSKMTMQDWVVESRIREIIDRGFGGDRNRLMDQLQRQKVSYPEWRQRMQDDMVVSAYGNGERIVLVSLFDNLGKGASGAAIENMNLVLGLKPETGLVVG